jgi:hypothetical protein
MGRKGMHIGFWWESQNERHHYEYVEIVGRTILMLILQKQDGVVLTGFVWLRIGISGRLS